MLSVLCIYIDLIAGSTVAHLLASANAVKIERKGFSFKAFLPCATVAPWFPLHNTSGVFTT